MKKEIIDNQKDNYTMSQFLNKELKNNGNTGELDISTGYFNISGFKLLSESLWKFSNLPDFRLRLLFGKEAISQEKNSENFEKRVETLSHEMLAVNPHIENGVESSLKDEINAMNFAEEPVNIINDLITFLRQDKLLVRSQAMYYKQFTIGICTQLPSL